MSPLFFMPANKTQFGKLANNDYDGDGTFYTICKNAYQKRTKQFPVLIIIIIIIMVH